MDAPRRPDPAPDDPVSGGPEWRPSIGALAAALWIVVGSVGYLAYWWWSSLPAAPLADNTPATLSVAATSPAQPVLAAATAGTPASAAPLPAPTAASRSAPVSTQRISRTRDPNGDLTPDLSDYVNEGERPTMAEVIDRLHMAGVHSGLGAFSPPGTRPPLVGLAVPEDFVLPEGYVRHYQATDDGQRIEPILMFAPNSQFFDASGQPIAVPHDRVVPPELAPEGLPIRHIAIPAPAEPGTR